MKKTIPLPDYVEMANDNDIYEVGFNKEEAQKWAEDGGAVITNFNDWVGFSYDTLVCGYGRNSGRSLWQVNREIQRQAYRICKKNAVSLKQEEVT